MLQLKTELLNIVTRLNEANVDYGLCGGLAVAVHGYPRATKDIDILILPDDLSKARSVLATIGFDLEAGLFKFDSNSDRERQLYRISKAEGTQLTTLDLMLVTPVMEEIWNNREIIRAFGLEIKVVSRDSLIKMKMLASRLQDLADIESLSGKRDAQ